MVDTKQKRIIASIKSFFPKNFGVKRAYYKIEEDKIDLVFFVMEENLAANIGYIKSLSLLLNKEFKKTKDFRKIRMECKIYIDKDSKSKVERRIDEFSKIALNDFSLDKAPCAA